jgi:hypothetical protein
METKLELALPVEVAQIAENVSLEKRSEVQVVLNQVFSGVSKMREQLDKVVVSDENDRLNMKLANTIRLGVRQVRLDAEKTFDAKRAEVQQQMVSFKTEDSLWLKAKQTMQILTKEIEENARWKEETKERFDLERKELKVQERINRLSKFDSTISRSEFDGMTDETFEKFFAGIEKDHNDKIEAHRKAEEERIAKEKAEAEERARIEAENKRLREESEAKEKQMQAERAKAEAERKAIEEKARQEKAAAELKLKQEREANEKLQAEIRDKAEAERKAKAELEAKAAAELKAKQQAEAKAAKAPKKEKLTNWIDCFVMGSPVGMAEDETVLEILEKFESFKRWSKAKIDSL